MAKASRAFFQPVRHQVAHGAVAFARAAFLAALPPTVHRQQTRMQHFAALGFAQRLPHNHIDRAGLVFQRDEYGALGRLWLRGYLLCQRVAGEAPSPSRSPAKRYAASG